MAVLRARTQLRGIDLIGYGFAAGVLIQALFGLGIACLPRVRGVLVAADAVSVAVSLVYLWRIRAVPELRATITRPMSIALALCWGSLCCVSGSRTSVSCTARSSRMAGDIFKSPSVNVKLQHLTILPADNAVPFIVTEYLLRRISFRTEAPILPGQEISNRTILLSLVALPYRAAISPPPRWKGSLGKFEYVGKRWPAVEKLYTESGYRQVLVIGMMLNGLLLLGLLVFFQDRSRSGGASLRDAPGGHELVRHHADGFCLAKIVGGILSPARMAPLRVRHHAAAVGACAALAYHSHPYAAIFAMGLGCYYVVTSLRERMGFRAVAEFGATFALLIAPWFIWTLWMLGLRSNLFWQNFAGPGTETGMWGPAEFAGERVINVFELFVPTLFGVYPYDEPRVSELAEHSLPAAVGLFLIVPAFFYASNAARRIRRWADDSACRRLRSCCFLPFRATPIMHGLQAVVGLLVVCGIVQLRSSLPRGWFRAFVVLQLATNLVALWLRARVTGVHLP